MASPRQPTPDAVQTWGLLRRWRGPLAAAIGLAFAVGQLIEAALLDLLHVEARLAIDVVVWGVLGAATVWGSLTWVSRQERRHETGLARALQAQRRLNGHLALLSEVNHHLVTSSTLDEILDAALTFPRRLAPVRAGALLLSDDGGTTQARASGASDEELATWRAGFGAAAAAATAAGPRLLPPPTALGHAVGAGVVAPLSDGHARIGWIELYLEPGATLAEDELALLDTITGEITEALVGARRRAREANAIYALEQAIADERSRIARDIHDGLAQSLAFLRLRVDLWQDWIGDDPDRLRAELRGLKATLREQIQELRRAIFALRPVQFDELGFVAGLNRYITEFAEQQGWQVEIDLTGAPPGLAHELEATCFRIVQEALTNVAKHAAARRVEVTIGAVDGGLQVRVSDDGRGFTPGEAAEAAPGHVGLRQMRERLAGVRGRLTVRSTPGAGTDLRAWLPLEVMA